jgi:hypothetical protein
VIRRAKKRSFGGNEYYFELHEAKGDMMDLVFFLASYKDGLLQRLINK